MLENILPIASIVLLFVLEGILEVALFSALGAFVRSACSAKKRSFGEYYSRSTKVNAIIGLGVLAAMFVLIVGIAKVVTV